MGPTGHISAPVSSSGQLSAPSVSCSPSWRSPSPISGKPNTVSFMLTTSVHTHLRLTITNDGNLPTMQRCQLSGDFMCGRSQGEWSRGMLRNVQLRQTRRSPCDASRRRRGGVGRGGRGPVALLDVRKELDQAKFAGATYRRTIFDYDDWTKHKSASRYLRHILSIVDSRVIGGLGPEVSFLTGCAAAVVIWNELYLSGSLPPWAGELEMSSLPFTLTSPALSLLLVFRTNASYGRFDEVRKMWGLMLNRTRDLTRQALTYMARGEPDTQEEQRALMMRLLRHLQAFPLTYKHHLVREGDLFTDLTTETSLTEEEVESVMAAAHRPNYVLLVMSECVHKSDMNFYERLCMDNNLITFADDIGGSERIFKTPIPVSYTRLTSRFVFLWLLFLPLALWKSCGWITILASFFISSALLCVDEVGVIIEEPFSILPLGAIAMTARNNVADLISLHDGIRARVMPNADKSLLIEAPATSSSSSSSSSSSQPDDSPPKAPDTLNFDIFRKLELARRRAVLSMKEMEDLQDLAWQAGLSGATKKDLVESLAQVHVRVWASLGVDSPPSSTSDSNGRGGGNSSSSSGGTILLVDRVESQSMEAMAAALALLEMGELRALGRERGIRADTKEELIQRLVDARDKKTPPASKPIVKVP